MNFWCSGRINETGTPLVNLMELDTDEVRVLWKQCNLTGLTAIRQNFVSLNGHPINNYFLFFYIRHQEVQLSWENCHEQTGNENRLSTLSSTVFFPQTQSNYTDVFNLKLSNYSLPKSKITPTLTYTVPKMFNFRILIRSLKHYS